MKSNTKIKLSPGFTMVELIVILAITVVLSGSIIANFRNGDRSRDVRVATDSIQSALRQMQNNILSGVQHPSGSPAGDFGFEITSGQKNYLTFSELPGGGSKQTLETVTLPDSVTISNIIVGGQAASKIEVRFLPPFGKIQITGIGTSYSQAINVVSSFKVRFRGETLGEKTVHVDGITGKISVE